jgi:hypothetical protein
MFSLGAFATRANCRAFDRPRRLIAMADKLRSRAAQVLNRLQFCGFIQIAGRITEA